MGIFPPQARPGARSSQPIRLPGEKFPKFRAAPRPASAGSALIELPAPPIPRSVPMARIQPIFRRERPPENSVPQAAPGSDGRETPFPPACQAAEKLPHFSSPPRCLAEAGPTTPSPPSPRPKEYPDDASPENIPALQRATEIAEPLHTPGSIPRRCLERFRRIPPR